MKALSDHDVSSLAAALAAAGHNPAAAWRVLRGYYAADGEPDLAALGISTAACAWIRAELPLRRSRVLLRHEGRDGTVKLLIGFDQGGGNVECVLMPSCRPDRAAACLSSQVGCAMGCDFCASTRAGLERNLSIGELVEQFIWLRIEARRAGRRIASLVFMGMGEPMHNLDNVIPAARLLAEPGLGAMGRRAITVSTVGIVPGIERLAEAGTGVQLALSLHAPDDATRSRLVPANRRWSVDQIMAAARRFQERAGRPVNIEYCLLEGVNDSECQAKLLSQRMRGFRAHVNLIPYNHIGAGISGRVYRRPSDGAVERFASILKEQGVVAHIRQTRGDDVWAACGQLRVSSASRSQEHAEG